MATTVFPLTDQTVTKALFDGAKNSIDEGSLDILTSIRGAQNYETDRKLLNLESRDTASDVWTNISSVEVPIGTAWMCRVTSLLTDRDISSPGDNLQLRVNCDTGVTCRGIAFTKTDNLAGSGIVTTYVNVSGTTQSFFGRPPASTTQENHITNMYFLLVGDTASGTFSIDARKATDTQSNSYNISYCTINASRIW